MITDDFTDTDGTGLTAHGPWTYLPSYPTALTSSFVISSNALAANLLLDEHVCARWSGNSFNDDQLSRGSLAAAESSANSNIGVAVRCATDGSLSTYIYFGHFVSSSTYKAVNGVATLLGNHGAFVAGDDIEISCTGTTVTSKKNGVTQFSGTDASLSSGSPGVWGNGNAGDTRLGEWSCTGSGGGPDVHALANYRASAGPGGINPLRVVYSVTYYGDSVPADIATGMQQEVEVSMSNSLTLTTLNAAVVSAVEAKAITLGMVIPSANVIIL